MNDFTLLIPTHQRAALLRRLLAYYERTSFPYDIVVADSSLKEIAEENERTCEHFSSLRLRYLSFDPKTEIFDKITETLAIIDSPYIALCSDDDFLATAASERAVLFLQEHADYAAVSGRSLSCTVTKYGTLQIVPHPQRSIIGKNSFERLEEYFKEPISLIYAVYRRPLFLQILTQIKKYRTDNTRFEELGFSLLTSVAGNVGLLESLHLIRQSSKHRDDSGSRQTKGWLHVAKSPAFEKNREKFMLLATTAVTDASNYLVKNHVDRWFSAYVKKETGVKTGTRATVWERAVAAALLPSAPTPLRQGIQRGIGILLSFDPRIQRMRQEFNEPSLLLAQYPDGMPKETP